jgi:uncharacterized protein
MLKIKFETLKHEQKIKIDETLNWKESEVEGEIYSYSTTVKVDLNVELSLGRTYVQGTVKTQIIHPCDRCLEPVKVDINGNVDAVYIPNEKVKEVEENMDEIGTFYYDPHIEFLDLTDRVIEAIILEIPMKVLCKPDCKGLCPHCGINLNEHPDHVCDYEEDKTESPFYVLKKKISFESKGE